MTMLRRSIATVLLIGTLAAPAAAQVHKAPPGPGPLPKIPVELWPGAITGMTPEEMAKAFPEAERVAGDTLGNGLKEMLRITPYDVDGVDYALKFFFDARHFRQVLVSLEPAGRDGAATTVECDRRTTALTEEFGTPEDANIGIEGEMSLRRSLQFTDGDRQIILLCLASRYGTSIVNEAITPTEQDTEGAE
jgi:hypothetical protein